MFFAAPVDAFVHIRFGMKPGGRLAFVCWQSAEQNPWSTLETTVASQYLPPPSPPEPDAPGPYALRERNRVNRILSEAGFTRVEITSVERKLTFTISQVRLSKWSNMVCWHLQSLKRQRMSVKRVRGEYW